MGSTSSYFTSVVSIHSAMCAYEPATPDIYIATIYSQSSSAVNGPVVGVNKRYILEKLVNAHCVSAVLAMYLGSQIYRFSQLLCPAA